MKGIDANRNLYAIQFEAGHGENIVRVSSDGTLKTVAVSGSRQTVRDLTVTKSGKILGTFQHKFDRFDHDSIFTLRYHPSFFDGETIIDGKFDFLVFANGVPFGFYRFLAEPAYVRHVDLGSEYVMDANNGEGGLYLYDFKSSGFFYTSPDLFPTLYDFNSKAFLYYFPDPDKPGHYTTKPRLFYNFSTGQVVSK